MKVSIIKCLTLLMCSLSLINATEYEISDVDTLQTKTSEAISINNKGQVLGHYNVDGTSEKHYFVRGKDKVFHELPKAPSTNYLVNWRHLCEDGTVYGTYSNGSSLLVYQWDFKNGAVNIGTIPSLELVKINDAGQFLIKSMDDNVDGKTVKRPVIWKNNTMTKLNGIENEMGIQSINSEGFDMNDKGEVVGRCLVPIVFKNEIYYQYQAVKWINGQPVSIHTKIPKSFNACAILINNAGDVVFNSNNGENKRYLLKNTNEGVLLNEVCKHINNNYIYNSEFVADKNYRIIVSKYMIRNKVVYDNSSIWMDILEILKVNENGEIIANGFTIYGENHIMFLKPIPTR